MIINKRAFEWTAMAKNKDKMNITSVIQCEIMTTNGYTKSRVSMTTFYQIDRT